MMHDDASCGSRYQYSMVFRFKVSIGEMRQSAYMKSHGFPFSPPSAVMSNNMDDANSTPFFEGRLPMIPVPIVMYYCAHITMFLELTDTAG